MIVTTKHKVIQIIAYDNNVDIIKTIKASSMSNSK